MTKHLPSVLGGIAAGLSASLAGAFEATFWGSCIAAGCGAFAGTTSGRSSLGKRIHQRRDDRSWRYAIEIAHSNEEVVSYIRKIQPDTAN